MRKFRQILLSIALACALLVMLQPVSISKASGELSPLNAPDTVSKTPETPDPADAPDTVSGTPDVPDPAEVPDTVSNTPDIPDPAEVPDTVSNTPDAPAPADIPDTVSGTPDAPDPAEVPDTVSGTPETLDPAEVPDTVSETPEEPDPAEAANTIDEIPVPLLDPTPSSVSIHINDQSYSSFEEAIAKANDGDTLVVDTASEEIEITTGITIPADKNLTIDLGGQTLKSSLEPNANLFYVSGVGSFTLKNGALVGTKKEDKEFTGRALYSESCNLTVDSVEASGFSISDRGSVVNADDGNNAVKISLTNNNFHDNQAQGSGGAVRISTNNQDTQTFITGNTIRNNLVSAVHYAFGGGISFTGKGVLELKGNTISANQSTVSDTYYDYYWSHGGGISIDSNFGVTGKNLHIILEGNTISENKTQLFGGGIYFFLNQKNGDIVDLNSGIFTGNHSGYAGGAIDYSVHGQPTLVLNNFLMTGNKAAAGGAIWACPTVHMDSYSTLGGAALTNELIDSLVDTRYKNSGHDIQFEGVNTTISSIKSDNDPTKHKATVVDRTFTGEKINWYADDAGHLYKEGDNPINLSDYTERTTTFGLYGKMEVSDWYERYRNQAWLIFENNTADVRGGVISSNSDIQIGVPEDVRLKVQKKWLDKDGKDLTENLPEKVNVQLIRNEGQASELKLETISLRKENNWQYVFEHLPSKGLDNGQMIDFKYSVKEVGDLKNFNVSYENEENPTDVKYSIIIKNQISDTPEETTTTTTPTLTIVCTTTPPTIPLTTTIPCAPTTTHPYEPIPQTGEVSSLFALKAFLGVDLLVFVALLLLRKSLKR